MRRTDVLHVAILCLLTAALFLPSIGRGFIHDDFVFLASAAFDPFVEGLTAAKGGPFYTPLTWLTFRADWALWGQNPFASALINLALHLVNIALVYALARYLAGDHVASLLSAAGFAVLVPSSVWAVMWIATRAHVLTATFFLAAILSTLIWTRTGKRTPFAGAMMFAACAIFSKEMGMTVIGGVVATLVYERLASGFDRIRTAAFMVAAIIGFGLIYLALRSNSGAVGISFGEEHWYSYTTSFTTLLDNIRSLGWRTYGWVGILFIASMIGGKIAGQPIKSSRPRFAYFAFPLALSAVALAPVILIRGRSGIYTYLSGGFAAVLLAQLLAGRFRPNDSERIAKTALAPAALLLMVASIFAVGQSGRWRTMAETNALLLRQIKNQLDQPAPNTAIVIEYSERDTANYFPDSVNDWGLAPAVRLLYSDPTLSGRIENAKEAGPPAAGNEIRFVYSPTANGPQVTLK